MTVAACLLGYTLAVVLLAPRVLIRLTAAGRAPRLGAAAWAAAIGSVASSWIAAALLLVVAVIESGGSGRLIQACVSLLQTALAGRYGPLVQAVLLIGAVTMLGYLTWQLTRSLRTGRVHRRRHAQAARLVGRRELGLDALVLDVEERAVYCLPGRPELVVVTSAALRALTAPQLAAVLAHEHAHLTGRHHLMLGLVRGLYRAFPRVRLFSDGSLEIARLLEMCADDKAAHHHGPGPVVGALLALAGPQPAPAHALGAADPTALARAQRLALPSRPVCAALTGAALAAVLLVLLIGPILATVLPAAGLGLCDQQQVWCGL